MCIRISIWLKLSGFIWSKTRGAQYRSNDEHSTNLLLTAIICQQSVINGHMLLCACYCRMNDTCSIGPARTTTPEGQHNNGRVSYSVIPLCPFHSIERFISRIVSYVLSKFTVLPFKEIIRKYDINFLLRSMNTRVLGETRSPSLRKSSQTCEPLTRPWQPVLDGCWGVRGTWRPWKGRQKNCQKR